MPKREFKKLKREKSPKGNLKVKREKWAKGNLTRASIISLQQHIQKYRFKIKREFRKKDNIKREIVAKGNLKLKREKSSKRNLKVIQRKIV